MKSLLSLIAFILFSHCSVNAQWYERACGVQDFELATSDEFECMWNKADKIVHVGMRTCGIGTGIVVVGGVTMFVSSASDGAYSMIGATGIICGLATVVVSVPIWAIGASRKNKLMDSPAYQDFQGTSLQISPMIEKNHLNKQASLGLAVSLNF
ncbi:MAG: hypothetical protein U9R49_03370 [Bacteroidota bacterium]|nr:hypothetical protein [Bacteroidota bacterium]